MPPLPPTPPLHPPFLPKRSTLVRLSLLVPLLLLLLACRRERQVVQETWSIVALTQQQEQVETVSETVVVRNCGVPETKSVFCSAGTVNELGLEFGGSSGFSGILGSSVQVNIGAVLGVGRESGESVSLPTPENGYVYEYAVHKTYTVIMGEALARSASGLEESGNFSFNARCEISVDAPVMRACPVATATSVAAPAPTLPAVVPTALSFATTATSPVVPSPTPQTILPSPTAPATARPAGSLADNLPLQRYTDPNGAFSINRPAAFHQETTTLGADNYGQVFFVGEAFDNSLAVIFVVLSESEATDEQWQAWLADHSFPANTSLGMTALDPNKPHAVYDEWGDESTTYAEEQGGVVLMIGFNGPILTQNQEKMREIIDSIVWYPDRARQAIQNKSNE